MPRRFRSQFFFILFFGAAILMYFILRPFIAPLFLAFASAVIFRPLYLSLIRRLGGRETLAAVITILILLVAILIPLFFVGGLIFNQSRDVYTHLSQGGGVTIVIDKLNLNIARVLKSISPDITFSLRDFISDSFSWTVLHLDTFFSGFVRIVIGLFVTLLALFYIMRDGSRLKKSYIALSPLSDDYDLMIMSSVVRAVNSVVRGMLLIALIQAIVATVGLAIAGIPNAILWGTMAGIVSLLPGISTGPVMLSAVAYLFYTNNILHAIFLILWWAVSVTIIDNIVGPRLIRRGMQIHHFLILLSILGGLILFGPIGILAGPIILSVWLELIALYPKVADNID